MQSLAQQYISRNQNMRTRRQTWDVLWDSVSRYCFPRKGNILTKLTPGQQQTIDLYDSTAEEAGGVFAAGCVTNICPAGEKWLRLEPEKEDAPAAVKEWFDKATDAVMRLIYKSNFYENIHETFFDAGHFGTSCLLGDEDKKMVINFVNIPVGSFAIEENCRGEVDTVSREWKWTARQAEQKWGKDKLGRQQQKALEGNDPNSQSREFTYIHFVEPRGEGEYVDGPAVGSKRPIRSMYICVEDAQVIEEGGYYTMPYFVNRLLRSNQEVYGRGPGTQKLPDVRIINTMVRDFLIALEKLANPGWLEGDDQTSEIDNRPNGRSYWDTSGGAIAKPEQLQLKNRVDYLETTIDKQREIIRNGYYNNLFQLLSNVEEQKREKTAFEVRQMVAEQLVLFSPLFGRITRETLNPAIERTFDVSVRLSQSAWARGEDGVLPLPPPELSEFPAYNVVYVSKIALAIKAAQNQAFAAMMTLVEQAAAMDPDVVDVVKFPEGVRLVARNVGLPASLVRTEREAAQRSAARAAALQQQQAPAQSEMSTQALKNLGPQAQEVASRKIIAAQSEAAA